MLTVTLSYSPAGSMSTLTRTFNVYGAKTEDVDFRHVVHNRINGGWSQSPVGYRYKGYVDFAPLLGDKSAQFWIQTFAFGFNRTIRFDWESVTRSVTLPDSKIVFDFYDRVSFANGFRLNYSEKLLRVNTDNGSTTRTLVPVYTPTSLGISGNSFRVYTNLLNDCDIQITGRKLSFIDGSPDDVSFAMSHELTLDMNVIFSRTERDWLRDFCLWKHKQIDTTAIDPVNGAVYPVIFPGNELVWDFKNGSKDSLAAKLTFYESGPQTVSPPYTPPPASHVFILDEDKLDEQVLA